MYFPTVQLSTHYEFYLSGNGACQAVSHVLLFRCKFYSCHISSSSVIYDRAYVYNKYILLDCYQSIDYNHLYFSLWVLLIPSFMQLPTFTALCFVLCFQSSHHGCYLYTYMYTWLWTKWLLHWKLVATSVTSNPLNYCLILCVCVYVYHTFGLM